MRSLLLLKPYLWPQRWLILGSMLLALPLAGLRTAPAVIVERLVDSLKRGDASEIQNFPLLFIAIYLLNFGVRFFHFFLMRIVVARVDQKIKNDIYNHLLGLSPDYFTEQSTGSLMSRANSDPQLISGAVINLSALIREPATFLFLFAYTLYLDWKLTLIAFLVFPPLAWIFAATGRNLKRYILGVTERNAQLYSTLQESFSGIRVVKMFNLEPYMKGKFEHHTSEYANILIRAGKMEEAAHPLVELLTSIVIAAVVYYGGNRIASGEMTTGELLAFFVAFAFMMNPIRALNDINLKMNQAAAACERVFQIFTWKSHITQKSNAARLVEGPTKEIRFESVRFAYPDAPTRPILDDVSFTAPAGKVLALVGASGSGKSSLVSLLPRIFDITSGKILVDGKDLRDYAIDDLRQSIAVVSQDVFLFNDTIEENIRCGRLSATREEILEAARHAHAMEFIDRLPQGLQTMIGDRGLKLSGGERQRLSIARAFLRRAPILILDEATSSLDSRSELAVQDALNELMVGRTTILVAHRLSTIRNADQILVIKGGKIVERGRHDELLSQNGEYSKFHALFQNG